MKTKTQNTLMILSLSFIVLACSKTETNDMMFKKAVSDVTSSSASPVPGEEMDGDSMPEPEVVLEPTPAPSPAPAPAPVVVVNPTSAAPTAPTAPAAPKPEEVKAPEEVVKVPTPEEVKAPEEVVKVPTPEEVKAPEEVVKVPTPEEVKAPEEVVKVPTPEQVKAPEEVVKVPTPEQVKAPGEVVKVPTPEQVKAPEEVVKVPCPEKKEEVIYPESDIPICELDVTISGVGSTARVAIASMSKDELMNSVPEGFDGLSASDLSAMRTAVDKQVSAKGVQVMKGPSAKYDKAVISASNKVMVVFDGKGGQFKLSGISAKSEVYIMNLSDKHDSLCVRANGVTANSKFFMTVKTDKKYAARSSADINGIGSNRVYMKTIGGHRTGTYYDGHQISSVDLDMITEGLNDTFTEIKANGIAGGTFDIKMKGKDDTGLGVIASHIKGGSWNMELEGEDGVALMMDIRSVSDAEVTGWVKAKSDAVIDEKVASSIDLMPIS